MKIALVTGGITGERAISLMSAKNIAEKLIHYDIDQYVFPEEEKEFTSCISYYDIVIPIIHGRGGEDGYIQDMCDQYGIPYLFSSATSHKVCFNKHICKEKVRSLGILAPETYLYDSIKYPSIYKAIDGGSSLDIKMLKKASDLETINASDGFIAEEFITGREFTVSVIERNNNIEGLPVIEIIKEGDFFNKEQKYSKNNSEYEICPANISQELSDRLKETALRIHKGLKLNHISRSDLILTEDNQIYFIEVNTIPGMTHLSLFSKSLQSAGHTFNEIFEYFIKKEHK